MSNKCIVSQFRSHHHHVQVVLNESTVLGVEDKLPNGNSYYAYKSIPYAEPPLGKLRFEDPVPLTKFSEKVLDCTMERDVSHQRDSMTSFLIGSENCLYLNVYSPVSTKDVGNAKPLAVMVWIHGGGFTFGSGNSDFYSPEYLIQENVVVVTLNYRLGALGFLCLPDAGISGNAGLKDQLTALKWVNRNISKFGGDAENVTLFGTSAGGASVGLHLLSDESRKYFHKAICQCATALHEWVIEPDPVGKSKKLAELLGFKGGSESDILAYLRDIKDLSRFHKHTLNVLTDNERARRFPMPFKPCIERKTPNAFLFKSPVELINQFNVIKIPVMMGYNSGEGILSLIGSVKTLDVLDKNLSDAISRSLIIPSDLPNDHGGNQGELIRNFYLDGQKVAYKLLKEISKLQGDHNFSVGMHISAEFHSRRHPNKTVGTFLVLRGNKPLDVVINLLFNLDSSPLYFYRFAHDGKLNLFKKLILDRLNNVERIEGACHGDEIFYLFNSKLVENERLDKSVSTRIANEMCKMWTNFAKYGNPTPVNDTSITVKWEPVTPPKDGEKFVLDYLEIDEKTQMLTDPDKERIEFWRNLQPKWNDILKAKL